ncbi:hypothetical protein V9L05_01090 [Bernardetia sp. Wsw4-3y2]|uniref:hypothetical protein n=1 Tax=unclassified Bernardetia TaxID=2647129 RepID=UPI0030CFC33A
MKSTLLYLLFMVVIFSSCQPNYYVPNMHTVPLLTQKGEGFLSVASSNPTFDSTSQISVQTSYLITNHFAAQTNNAFHNLITGSTNIINSNNTNKIGTKGQMHELGFGYLFSDSIKNRFLKKNIKRTRHIGIWGIAAIGNIETYIQNQGKLNANMFLVGINPTFSKSMKYISASMSFKTFYLRYTKVEGDLLFGGKEEVEYLSNRKHNFIIEPAMTARIGLEKFKFVFQFLCSNNIKYGNERQTSLILSLGLTYNFYTQKNSKID